MRNLSDMNDIYTAQDVIILCKIVENRFELLRNAYGYNPRKYNSASSFSGCIQKRSFKNHNYIAN